MVVDSGVRVLVDSSHPQWVMALRMAGVDCIEAGSPREADQPADVVLVDGIIDGTGDKARLHARLDGLSQRYPGLPVVVCADDLEVDEVGGNTVVRPPISAERLAAVVRQIRTDAGGPATDDPSALQRARVDATEDVSEHPGHGRADLVDDAEHEGEIEYLDGEQLADDEHGDSGERPDEPERTTTNLARPASGPRAADRPGTAHAPRSGVRAGMWDRPQPADPVRDLTAALQFLRDHEPPRELVAGLVDRIARACQSDVALLRRQPDDQGDDGWDVIGGMGLRPLETRRLGALPEPVAALDVDRAALCISETDVLRAELIGVPLARHRSLLAFKYPADVLLVAGRERPFDADDVRLVSAQLRGALPLLQTGWHVQDLLTQLVEWLEG